MSTTCKRMPGIADVEHTRKKLDHRNDNISYIDHVVDLCYLIFRPIGRF